MPPAPCNAASQEKVAYQAACRLSLLHITVQAGRLSCVFDLVHAITIDLASNAIDNVSERVKPRFTSPQF